MIPAYLSFWLIWRTVHSGEGVQINKRKVYTHEKITANKAGSIPPHCDRYTDRNGTCTAHSFVKARYRHLYCRKASVRLQRWLLRDQRYHLECDDGSKERKRRLVGRWRHIRCKFPQRTDPGGKARLRCSRWIVIPRSAGRAFSRCIF